MLTACFPYFSDELQKISWLGTYYHGTTPEAEQSILREGLQASRGGTGASKWVEGLVGAEHPLVKKFQKETAGKVSLSRSKTLSKLYGLAGRREQVVKALNSAKSRGPIEMAREGAKQFLQTQPLEVAGKALSLKRDPSHLLLGVQSAKDIAPGLIRKSQPSRIGRVLSKLLARK